MLKKVAILALAIAPVAACGTGSMTLASAGPTAVTSTLHIEEPDVHFAKYVCREAGKDPCRGLADSTGDGSIRSTLAGDGTSQFELVVDDSDPGPNGDCNTVREVTTFTFASGTISVESLHRDCNFGGPRIQTLFVITGGTGQFAGATGYGTESDATGITYDATFTYLPRPVGSTPA